MRVFFMLCSLFAGSQAWALQVGDQVPDLAVPSTAGHPLNLRDFDGQWVVLYFYPRAFTPGCTAQTCSLRDEHAEMHQRGVVVLGASLDNEERQRSFKEEHGLPFELLSDNDKELARAFDALMIGELMAARRTFIINPEGRLAFRFDRPQTHDHAEEVLAKLDELREIRETGSQK